MSFACCGADSNFMVGGSRVALSAMCLQHAAAHNCKGFIQNLFVMKLHPPPVLIDTTLRDGEQAPGVVFSLADKMTICGMLDEAGIQEVELGTPAMGAREVSDLNALNRAGFGFITTAWCRALPADIIAASKTGCHGVHFSFPVSDILLESIGKHRDWIVEQLETLVELASDLFPFFTVGAQDASRANPDFLRAFTQYAALCGASRVRIADTVGLLTPNTTARLFRNLMQVDYTIPLEFHAHNDLGLAAGNVLAAANTGVNCFSVTVNGLGERAGNAALEEVVMAFEYGEKINTGINTKVFSKLSRFVAEASNRPLHAAKPITGEMALAHESGMHTNSIIKNRSTYQLLNAADIGRNDMPFVFGKHSGRESIRHFFNSINTEIFEKDCSILLDQIKWQSENLKRAISESEILELYNQMQSEKDLLQSNTALVMQTSLSKIENEWLGH